MRMQIKSFIVHVIIPMLMVCFSTSSSCLKENGSYTTGGVIIVVLYLLMCGVYLFVVRHGGHMAFQRRRALFVLSHHINSVEGHIEVLLGAKVGTRLLEAQRYLVPSKKRPFMKMCLHDLLPTPDEWVFATIVEEQGRGIAGYCLKDTDFRIVDVTVIRDSADHPFGYEQWECTLFGHIQTVITVPICDLDSDGVIIPETIRGVVWVHTDAPVGDVRVHEDELRTLLLNLAKVTHALLYGEKAKNTYM